MRLIAGGGTTITEEFARDMSATYGAIVKRTYGSTEAPIVTTSFPGDPVERGWTTDGRVAPGAEVELRDPASDGRSTGRVRARCGSRPRARRRLPRSGADRRRVRRRLVPHLGPRGLRRRVAARHGADADIIIRAGANISASEVENTLEQHPAVRQAVVVGYPDDLYGERIGAFVVSDEPLDRATCVDWFAAYGLAKYKVPDLVVVVDEIPVLASFQKPDRNALRERLTARGQPRALSSSATADASTSSLRTRPGTIRRSAGPPTTGTRTCRSPVMLRRERWSSSREVITTSADPSEAVRVLLGGEGQGAEERGGVEPQLLDPGQLADRRGCGRATPSS